MEEKEMPVAIIKDTKPEEEDYYIIQIKDAIKEKNIEDFKKIMQEIIDQWLNKAEENGTLEDLLNKIIDIKNQIIKDSVESKINEIKEITKTFINQLEERIKYLIECSLNKKD